MTAAHTPSDWFPQRGEIYWAKLDKVRPALVLSVDALNRRSLDVCVVPFTTVERAHLSVRTKVEAQEAGLKTASWAKCDQVVTVPKLLLAYPPAGRVSKATMAQIEVHVRICLGLIGPAITSVRSMP